MTTTAARSQNIQRAAEMLHDVMIFIAAMGGELCTNDFFERAMQLRRINPDDARAAIRFMAKLGIVQIEGAETSEIFHVWLP